MCIINIIMFTWEQFQEWHVYRLLLSHDTVHVRILANGLKPVDCFIELKFDIITSESIICTYTYNYIVYVVYPANMSVSNKIVLSYTLSWYRTDLISCVIISCNTQTKSFNDIKFYYLYIQLYQDSR